ncbi:MAG TPA: NADP-dependent oxidoreductase [Polyangiales bacterium]
MIEVNRQWLLARRPRGLLREDDFAWHERPPPEPARGQALVRNLCLSCDPTQHSWAAGATYFPAVRVGEVMRSFAVGEVVRSNDPQYRPGQLLQGLFGWQDYALTEREPMFPTLTVPSDVTIEQALSVLGNNGITAYFGLLDVGRAREGETVVVSAAAGATGSVVGQIAKLIGCRVVGITGGATKCAYVRDVLGFDEAVDYKAENVVTRLRQACPRGIDLYFDNVGGRILEAALANLALRGRVVVCGAISGYDVPGGPPGPRNYMRLLTMRGRMEGFVVVDYMARAAEALVALTGWLRAGKLRSAVDVQYGLERVPVLMGRLFRGQNVGKQLVRIAEAGRRS